MSKVNLLKKILNHEKVDRVPFSYGAHIPEFDKDAEKIADAIVKRYKKHDLDFIGNASNGLYTVEDYVDGVDDSSVFQGGVA